MKHITRPVNLLFDLFRTVKSEWLSDLPCPACKGGMNTCSFCSAIQKDGNHNYPVNRRESLSSLFLHKEKANTKLEEQIEKGNIIGNNNNKEEEEERKKKEEEEADMELSLKLYLNKHQLKLETKLCGKYHYTEKEREECEKHGSSVHYIEKLKSHYGHPLVKKYFMHNLIKNKAPGDRLPSLPLNLSHLFMNDFACINSKQSDRIHHVHATIYTHDKSGRLRPPMCSLKCCTCGQSTSICVYESPLQNKRHV
jgi:hypothetical protein